MSRKSPREKLSSYSMSHGGMERERDTELWYNARSVGRLKSLSELYEMCSECILDSPVGIHLPTKNFFNRLLNSFRAGTRRLFRSGMAAKVLSGTETAKEVRKALAQEVSEIKAKEPSFKPKLVIVQVGGREDSNVYIRTKIKAAGEVGVETEHVKFPSSVTENELLMGVEKLNADPKVHGIIVQLPLDCTSKIDAGKITNAVSPLKDVDGIHIENAGRLAHGELEDFFLPCTPRGCLELIQRTGIDISGKHAVVIGRSKIVGAPMSCILRTVNATVTVCHSRTKDVASFTRQADIIVAAVGVPRMVKKDWVKPGAVVIDCGINSIPDPSSAKGSRLVGDVDYDAVKEVASWITPVPGGVGPMTVAMLIKNTVISAKRELVGKLQNF